MSYAWHWETTLIANQRRPLAVASDPDAMLIDACQRQDAGESGVIDPFWATTWRAASGLDRFLEQRELIGTRVLEVGCGTGHAGIAAACRGADVTLTDGVLDPLHLVRLSLRRNALACRTGMLRLGIDVIEGEAFPLMLGSDVTYLRTLWPELLLTADQHLACGGELLLSDPQRLIGNEFREWIQDKPWTYSEHRVALEDTVEHPIRVMCLQRESEA
ncbi:MAG: methyltransferase domain-containing protein [Planctomycetota bacterium]